jgi:hypothetical protein
VTMARARGCCLKTQEWAVHVTLIGPSLISHMLRPAELARSGSPGSLVGNYHSVPCGPLVTPANERPVEPNTVPGGAHSPPHGEDSMLQF